VVQVLFNYLKQADVPIILVEDESVVWINRGAARLLGISQDLLSGKPFSSLFPELQASGLLSAVPQDTPSAPPPSTALIPIHGCNPIQITVLFPEPKHPEKKLLFLEQLKGEIASDLEPSEEIYRSVLQDLYDGFIIIQDDRIKYVNPLFASNFGYELQDMLDHVFQEFVQPDEVDNIWQYYAQLISGEQAPRELETVLVDKHGRSREVSLYSGLIPYAGETADFVLIRDLSRQKELERSLRITTDRYRAILDNLSELVWIVDSDGKILFVSPSSSKVLGCKPGSLIGKRIFDYVHPDDLNLTVQALAEVARDENPHEPTEFRFRHNNGRWVFVEALGQNMQDHPAINGHIITMRNVSDRKQAQEQLEWSEERYQRVANLTSDGIITADQKGFVTSCNQAFLDATGYEVEDIVGKHFTRVPTMARQRMSEYSRIFRNIFLDSRQPGIEFRWTHADGSQRWGKAFTSLVQYRDGTRQLQAILRDITEQKRTEMLFRALNRTSEKIADKNTPEEIYQTLADVFKEIGISSVFLMLEEGGHKLRPAYLSHSRNVIRAVEKITKVSRDDFSFLFKGFHPFDQIIGERKTVFETELDPMASRAMPGLTHSVIKEILRLMGFTRMIGAPITMDNTSIGILCVLDDNLLEKDTAAISFFAQQLSSALEKATLLERARAEVLQRTRAELALQESEARLQSLINAIPEPTFMIGPKNQVLAANQSFLNRIVHTSQETLNHTVDELFPGEFLQGKMDVIERVRQTGTGLSLEETRDDKVYINYIQPVHDAGTSPARIAVFSVDITDQKRNETHIKQLLKRQIILNQISVSLSARTNTEQIYELVHEQIHTALDFLCFRISLYQPEQSVIQTEFLHILDRKLPSSDIPPTPFDSEEKCAYSRVIATGKPIALSASNRKDRRMLEEIAENEAPIFQQYFPKEGLPSIASALIVPMKIGNISIGIMQICSETANAFDNSDIEFISALAGMTAISIQNSKLLLRTQHQAQQMHNIIRSVPEGVVLLSADLEIMMANPAANDILSVLCSEFPQESLDRIGDHSIEDLLTPNPDGLWHEIREASEDPSRLFEGLARPLSSHSPQSGWVLLLREVTHEREIQQRIQQQERLASVGQLAAGIAHDFNNIMVPIVLYSEMMHEEAGLSPEIRERLEIILNQSQRAASLTQQILDFSRRSVIQSMPLNLTPFLKEMKRLLERTLPESIQITLQIQVDEPTILADITRMQQVFLNIALNARDAMPHGGTLSFVLESCETTPDKPAPLPGMPHRSWLRIRARDTGTGIPEKDLAHIFEPFFTTKGPDQGSGLGLAQVYGIIKQHDGFIHVTSQSGEYTEFIMYLPAYSRTSDPGLTDALPREKGFGRKVLIVEDDPAVRTAVSEVLTSLDYLGIPAESTSHALEIYRDSWQEISLILSDMVMPHMSGIELLQKLQVINPEVRMIVMSGYPLGEKRSISDHPGVVGWIQKPIGIQSVANALSAALAEKESE